MGDGSALDATVRVKVATEAWEFDEIHRLNHATFVEEIPQHAARPSGLLVDAFHEENTYLVALQGEQVVGMLALRGNRPFSLDRKLPDLDAYLPPGHRFCEVRLLAIAGPHRSGRVLQRLLASLWDYSLRAGFDAAVISGTTAQLRMYGHLGFVPFGPLVGTPGAQYQPMFITRDRARRRFAALASGRDGEAGPAPVNLLPGPVDVRRPVRRALDERPESHRSQAFIADLATARRLLCGLTGARHAAILVGSGTLANDVIGAQLSLIPGPGVVLTNGEFGDRLVDHASRLRLTCDVIARPWGAPFDLPAIERRLMQEPPPAWLWFVHLETSTGVLNDFSALASMCARRGVRLCVDAISATGIVPVDLSHASFGSTVSGKGLGAFPGLSIVFHDQPVETSGRIPRYLDLALYTRDVGVPFTHSSNLLRALSAAVGSVDWSLRFEIIARRSTWLRALLRQHGFRIVSAEADAAPGVITIALPAAIDAARLGEELAADGYLLSAASEYLRSRNWIQISLMSQPSDRQLCGVVEALVARCEYQPGG